MFTATPFDLFFFLNSSLLSDSKNKKKLQKNKSKLQTKEVYEQIAYQPRRVLEQIACRADCSPYQLRSELIKVIKIK